MKVFYLFSICVWATQMPNVHSQFFYSHFQPISPPIFSPLTYQPPIYHPPVLPPTTYNFAPPTPPAQSTIQFNIQQQPEYRGFGYRTDLKNGATSTVFYVTGPQSQTLKNFRDFPNFSRKFQPKSSGKEARKLASDIIDSTVIPNAEKQIENLLDPKAFQRLFDDAMKGVINFYSYPASTVPLSTPTSNPANASVEENNENVAAESVINSHVLINQIDNMIKESKTTESNNVETTTINENSSSSTTTSENPILSTSEQSTEQVPETSSSSTTTEDAESIEVEARNNEIGTTESESAEPTTEFRIIV